MKNNTPPTAEEKRILEIFTEPFSVEECKNVIFHCDKCKEKVVERIKSYRQEIEKEHREQKEIIQTETIDELVDEFFKEFIEIGREDEWSEVLEFFRKFSPQRRQDEAEKQKIREIIQIAKECQDNESDQIKHFNLAYRLVRELQSLK